MHPSLASSRLFPRRVAASPDRRSRRAAFTLLELVLVLAIIAVAIGVAMPSLGGFVKNRDLADTASHFVAVTRYARTQAISQATIYHVNINTTEGRWWLTKADSTGTNFVTADPTGEGDATLSPKLLMACSLPLQDDAQFIEFQPTGQSDPATVTFSGPDHGSILVACDSPFNVYHIVKPGGLK